MKQWQCTVCGYIHNGPEPPDKCPVCGADRSKFILLEQPASSLPRKETAALKATQQEASPRSWRCTVCGYIYTGDGLQEKCPVCGSDRSLFVELTEGIAGDLPSASNMTQTESSSPMKINPIAAWMRYPKILTTLHGHPISVHIPNGVLPVAVFFTILSIILKSEAIATAAKFNMFFVTMGMPVVLISGLGDWINRYGGRMSRIFAVKMICGAIVSVLCLTLSIWWFFQPTIILGELPRLGTFIIFHLLALAAAGVAGFFGGKLVFPND